MSQNGDGNKKNYEEAMTMMMMMMMMMLMMDDYYFGFVVASEYHFRILRQESISNALQQSGGLNKATLGLYRPTPPKPGKIISGSVDNATKNKVTTVIYYSPPSAAGSTPSLDRIPLRSLSSAIAPSPTPLPRNHSFPRHLPAPHQ